MFRKTLFWLHLVCGVIAGLVIGIMSFTGAALAFEKELIAFAERDARHITPPSPDAKPLPLDELLRRVRENRPDARFAAVLITNEPQAAVSLTSGGRGGGPGPGGGASLYANPYTGEVREASAPRTRAFLRTMNAWHRWLGVEGEHRNVARAVTGACNAAFLLLAVTGLYLWWPRNWTANAVRAVAWFRRGLRGKPRDFNWHNVVGLWSAPVLIVLTATALPMSYTWANNALYRLTGSEPPAPGGGRGGPPSGSSGPSDRIPAPTPDARPLGYADLLARVQQDHPNWEQVTLRLGAERPTGERPQGNRESRTSGTEPAPATPTPSPRTASAALVTLTLKERGTWPRTATTTLSVNPYTAQVVRSDAFENLPAGRRLRTWTRFLHTGEAVGWAGQLIAGLASLGALLLVYTGLALTWRRLVS